MPTLAKEVTDLLNAAAKRDNVQVVGASADEIELLRYAIGFEIPKDLCHWLSICKGISVAEGQFLGTAKQLSIPRHTYPEWREHRWIPVASDGCGNAWCLMCDHPKDTSPVVFVDSSEDLETPAYLAASGLWPFLLMALHTDEDGNSPWFEKAKMEQMDPASKNIKRNIPRGWDE